MMNVLKWEFAKCKICGKEYSEKRKPHTLNCGNTLCRSCLDDHIKKGEGCYFDKSHYHEDITKEAPVNINFLSVILSINELAQENINNNSTYQILSQSKSKSKSVFTKKELEKLMAFKGKK